MSDGRGGLLDDEHPIRASVAAPGNVTPERESPVSSGVGGKPHEERSPGGVV